MCGGGCECILLSGDCGVVWVEGGVSVHCCEEWCVCRGGCVSIYYCQVTEGWCYVGG